MNFDPPPHVLLVTLLLSLGCLTISVEPEICGYARICKHFDDRSATCHSEDEASSYCGSYDNFENYKSDSMLRIERKLFIR